MSDFDQVPRARLWPYLLTFIVLVALVAYAMYWSNANNKDISKHTCETTGKVESINEIIKRSDTVNRGTEIAVSHLSVGYSYISGAKPITRYYEISVRDKAAFTVGSEVKVFYDCDRPGSSHIKN